MLIEKHADTVTTEFPSAYKRLRDAVAVLGGTLEHQKPNEPRGGTWVLTLGDKRLKIPSEQAMRYPALDACYRLKDGIAISQTWKDHVNVIDPGGLAELFRLLASSEESGSE